MLRAFLVRSSTAWKAAGRGLNIPVSYPGQHQAGPQGQDLALGVPHDCGEEKEKEEGVQLDSCCRVSGLRGGWLVTTDTAMPQGHAWGGCQGQALI